MTKEEQHLRNDNEALKNEIRELKETLDAIREGEVDAIIVSKDKENKIYTLENIDLPYRVLIENIREGALSISVEGLILYANTAFSSMRGLPLEKIIGTNFRDHIFKNDLQRFDMLLKNARTGPTRDKMSILSGEDSFPVLVSMSAFDLEGNTKISAVVTDRRDDYEHLKLQGMMLEAVTDAVVAVDTAGNIIYWNNAAVKIFGWKPGEVVGQDLISIWKPEVSAQKSREFVDNLMKGEICCGEFVVMHRDGHFFPAYASNSVVLDESGYRIAVLLTSQDITERKRAEERLHATQKRTASILENIADTFYSIDNQWRFTVINPAAEKAPFGRPAAEMLGKVIWDLYPGLIGTRIQQHYFDAAEKHSMKHYIAQSPLNGQWYEVFMQGHADGIDVYMRDVTDRKMAEEVLRVSEEKYRGLFENVQESVAIYRMVYDQNGKAIDRIFVDVNPKALSQMGDLKREDVIGKSYSDVVSRQFPNDEKSIDKHLQSLATVVQSGIPVTYDSHFGKKYYLTTQYPLNQDLVASSSIEITERKKAEEALNESERKYRELVENINSIFIKMDTAGKISFFNEYAQKFFGYSVEEVLGQDVRILVPPTDIEGRNLVDMVPAILKDPDGFSENENENVKKNGERAWILWRNKAIRDAEGNIIGNLAIGQDITERKRAEEALLNREKQLREANTLLEAVTDATKVIIAVEDSNFRYTYFNKNYAAVIKGLTGKELVMGVSMIDVFSELPKEQRSELDEWSRVLQGERVNQHITFDDPLKGKTTYYVFHVPLRDENQRITGAGEIAFDITSQVRVEEALRETSQYLTNLIDYANAPMIVWDPQFRITLFNHAFERLTGRKAHEVIGAPLEILIPETYLKPAMELIQKTSEGERWESVEIPILHKNSGIRTVLWNSAAIFGDDGKTVVSTIAQGQDITDRKKIESEYRIRADEYAKMNIVLEDEIRQRKLADANLKKTLSLLNASLESTADGILVVDRKGNLTSHNQNLVNMWNIPGNVLKSENFERIITYFQELTSDPDRFSADMNGMVAHPGRESYDMIELKDGRIFERYSKPQKIGNTVVGRVWSFRDITERIRSEERLLGSLQEKEVLLREIHHRVKNNLQLVSGLLDMTRTRTQDELTTGILTDMMLKIQTMAQIHTRLYESKQFGKIGLKDQVRDQTVALSNVFSYHGHEISSEIHMEEIFLPVDQALPCALVINEILSNSYKHAFKGKKQGTIKISAVQANGQIRITVRDNGIGMPERFDIASANSLGLKLVRTLVQHQLKGSLMINSRDGTETIVAFPLMIMER
jgi:PAS domain S-box-containing protein